MRRCFTPPIIGWHDDFPYPDGSVTLWRSTESNQTPLSTRQFQQFTQLPIELRQKIYAIASADFFNQNSASDKLNRGVGVVPEEDTCISSGLIPFLAPVTYASKETYKDAVLIPMKNVLFIIPSSRSIGVFINLLSKMPKSFTSVRQIEFEYINQFAVKDCGIRSTNHGHTTIYCGCEETPSRHAYTHSIDSLAMARIPQTLSRYFLV